VNTRFVKTKILATIGPASDNKKMLLGLIDAGVNALRMNFSHGDEDYFTNLFNTIHEVCETRKMPIPILQDLQGPKIRVGKLEESQIEIFEGNEIEITIDSILGNEKIISSSYKELIKDSKIGNLILIDDGLIKLEIKAKKDKSLICKIIEGGILKPKKGMNLPGMRLSTPSFTEADKKNMEFAFKHRVDYVALSFVRFADDIHELRSWMKSKGYDKPIIAKIEKPEAVENFEGILEASDGIMVARGDLGVELAPQLVPIIQKNIISRCNSVGKLVITATQMLESMITNPIPTRAEASDVANAVLDGTDVVMLSGETAVGKYPIQTIKTMKNILLSTESQDQFKRKVVFEHPTNQADNIFDSTGQAFVRISDQVNAKALVVFTHQGRKANILSKYNPNAHIFAFSDSFDTLNHLNLHKGIMPFFIKDIMNEEYYIKKATEILLKENIVNTGDVVVFTAGAPIDEIDRKSWVRFLVV
jgi:pyruvate kinase